MAVDLNALFREIHRLRRFARDLQEGIDRYPRTLKTELGRVTFAEQQLKDEQEALKRLKITQHQKEVDLKTREVQLDRSQKKLTEVSVQKQIDALNSEIAQGKIVCGQLEEEILGLIDEIETQSVNIPQLEQKLATIRAEYQTFEVAATAKKSDQEKLLKQAVLDLAELEKSLPASVLDQYQRCVKGRGADALAQLKDRVCSACSTSVTSQQSVELQSQHFSLCNSCGRILYLPPAARSRDEDDE